MTKPKVISEVNPPAMMPSDPRMMLKTPITVINVGRDTDEAVEYEIGSAGIIDIGGHGGWMSGVCGIVRHSTVEAVAN